MKTNVSFVIGVDVASGKLGIDDSGQKIDQVIPNTVIRRFDGRLLSRGKPTEVVQAAAMRKLVTILHDIVRSGEPWRREHLSLA